ncbi:molecular chaperone HtpG [Chlamydiia bacterium]|nr:molecular chaperone HtpG [Chlamydiia bacterium]
MSKKKLKINSQNLLPIIKKWLYSSEDIFLRELVSNSCDALRKLSLINKTVNEDDLRISVSIDKEKNTISISDNGIGMSKEEVEKYISQIAFSSAQEFADKYEKNKSDESAIIGHFGLGFYSAFIAADTVEIETQSHDTDQEPAFWSCDGSESYTIKKGSRETVGTTVTLHLNDENKKYLDASVIKNILSKYCSFFPFHVYLDEECLNETKPLWLSKESSLKDEDYKTFYRKLYPTSPEPLFWVHLDVDYPFNLKGILYFPKLDTTYSPEKNKIQLYCNRVFVTDDCKNILPDYLQVLSGAIDSKDLPLNVSRSAIQESDVIRKLNRHISKKVADALKALFKNDRDAFNNTWENIHFAIKYGVQTDTKFYDHAHPVLSWKTVDNKWISYDELRKDADKETLQTIYYTDSQTASPSSSIDTPIIISDPHADVSLFSFLEKKHKVSFERIDSSVKDDDLEKKTEEKDDQGKTRSEHIVTSFKEYINEENVDIDAKYFKDHTIPGYIIKDEKNRRFKEYLDAQQMDGFDTKQYDKKTFVLNMNSPVIDYLEKQRVEDKAAAEITGQRIFRLCSLLHENKSADEKQDILKDTFELLNSLTKSKG